MTSFFEHQRFSFKRNYLRNLIMLASSDGQLDAEEMNLIHTIGRKRGLKDWQIQETLMDTSNHSMFLPESSANRMNLLYDLMEIIYIDGEVSEKEVTFIRQIIQAFTLPDAIADALIALFSDGSPTSAEWSAFTESIHDLSYADEKLLAS